MKKIKIWITSFLIGIKYEIHRHPVSVIIMITSFTSKVFLGNQNEYGFILATIASLLTSWKFWVKDNMKRLSILEFLTTGILIYAFIKWRENNGKIEISENENTFFLILGALISILYIIDTIRSKKTLLSILEKISVFCFMMGGVLIFNKIPVGWLIYSSGCFITAKIQFEKKDRIFVLFQIISGLLCISVLIKQIFK